MPTIKIHDKEFTPYITDQEIQEKIQLLAQQLKKDYGDKKPLFLSILNGSFLFTADLFKHLDFEAEVCFVKLASYKGVSSTGNVITANITDTGWVDLDGFTYYGVGVTKPQCRRIGNQIHFRGTVFVPLENPSSPGDVVSLSSTSAYNSVGGCNTWSGTGGCTIDAFGAIYFNNGRSVIPTSVTANNIDDPYSLGWIVAVRPIDVDATYGTSLSSMMNIYVTSTNGLTAAMVHDIEITSTRGSGVQGNSPLRLLTSNVRSGEYLPNYIASGSDIHNAPSNANFPLVSDTFNLTWPFSCDAGNENQVGGFAFKLDGLIAYLDPCNTEKDFSATC